MIIDFNEKEHIYMVNGEIASISVTELLRKHGLAPNYEEVDKEVLVRAAARGTNLHKAIESYINNTQLEEELREDNVVYFEAFKDYFVGKFDSAISETKIAIDYKGLVVAGSIDLLASTKDNKFYVIDHKRTSSLHKEYLSWQLSLYDYMLRYNSNRKEKINGKEITWLDNASFICLWYHDNVLEEIEINKVSDIEIEKLLECEIKNEKYQRPGLVIDKELELALLQAEETLEVIERKAKQAKENAESIRAKILELMQKQNIVSFDNAKLHISYIPETTRVSVDSTRLKKELPKVYEEYQKQSKVKATLRIKLKDLEE